MSGVTAEHIALHNSIIAFAKDLKIPTVKRAGWERKYTSRNTYNPFMTVHHWTGGDSTPESMLFDNGNGIVPGPLCNYAGRKDGTLVLGAAGYSNNAGMNDANIIAELRDGDVDPNYLRPGSDSASANRHSVGIENISRGRINDLQYHTNIVLAAGFAYAKKLYLDPDKDGRVIPAVAHGELTRRKVDINHDMMVFRRDAKALLLDYVNRLGEINIPLKHETPKPKPMSTILREGSKGSAVVALQNGLAIHGFPLRPDGIFGSQTKFAVRVFQLWRGLSIDGLVGPATTAMLNKSPLTRIDRPLVGRGASGMHVTWLQKCLRATVAEGLIIDGDFGYRTDLAVRKAQALVGETVDGKVGNDTWPWFASK